jgi:DNA-binding XRE family transcriptional regulator
MLIILKSKTTFNQKITKLGYSKRNFARTNGLSEATIIQISNGKQSPRPETARKICAALEVDFDTIFRIVEEPSDTL